MKSYFLEPIASRDAAATALSSVLPAEGETWLLKDGAGDVMAYFYLSLSEVDDKTGAWLIQADISGRHYNRNADVVSVLEKIKQKTGGEITNDA